jgi:integrase
MRPDDGRWFILDRGKQISTRARGREGEEAAQEALKRYLAEQVFQLPAAPLPLALVSVDQVLSHYLDNLRPDIADWERQGYGVQALMKFWTRKTCADINERSCRSYNATRNSDQTARRELGILRAALGVAHNHGIIPSRPTVWLPAKGDPNPDWLERSEVARLLWELRRNKRTRHTARFLICMFYTGSRVGTISRTTWEERRDGPWVDLEKGLWYRSGVDERKTAKRRGTHRIPRRLLNHLRIWRRADLRRKEKVAGASSVSGKYVIEYPRLPGQPVKDIGNSLASACRRAGMRKITPHVLKHTAITNAIGDGMSVEQAADFFSTSVATIQTTYWHHSPHHQHEAVEIMNRLGRQRNATK